MFQNFFNFSRTNIKNIDRIDMTKNLESVVFILNFQTVNFIQF